MNAPHLQSLGLLLMACLTTSLPAQGDTDTGERHRPTVRLDTSGDRVGGLNKLIEQWQQNSRIISREQQDWKLGKEMLLDRIAVQKSEIESLRQKLAQADQSITEVDRKKVDLAQDNERMKLASQSLNNAIRPLELRMLALLRRMPEPLANRVQAVSQRIPSQTQDQNQEQIADGKLTLSLRFAHLIFVLNECDKFQREISVHSEVRKLADGRNAEVTALYLGLGQAFYATAKGDAAGLGSPGRDTFVWTPADKYAANIAEAIAVLKNEKSPTFVKLPIRIQ